MSTHRIAKTLTAKQADAAQADWASTLGTNYDNRAVKIERTATALTITNETGDVIEFKIR